MDMYTYTNTHISMYVYDNTHVHINLDIYNNTNIHICAHAHLALNKCAPHTHTIHMYISI